MCTLVCSLIHLKFYIAQPKLYESYMNILVKPQNKTIGVSLGEKKSLKDTHQTWAVFIKGRRMLVEGEGIFVKIEGNFVEDERSAVEGGKM